MAYRFSTTTDTTTSIPTEIMASIFQLSVQDLSLGGHYDPENSWGFQSLAVSAPLKLGAICKRWREIAWSTPFLWTNLAISLDLSNELERVELVGEWLSRSKELPLRVIIALDYFKEETFEDSEVLLAVIAETSYRWHYIDTHMPWEFTKNFYHMAEELPIIHTLGLHVTDEPSRDSTEDYLLWDEDTRPAPAKLYVSPFVTSVINIVWASITEVEINYLRTKDCIDILHASPNIEICKFSKVIEFGVNTSNPGPTFVHQNLRHLTYDSEDAANDEPDLFSVVTLPNLTHFTYAVCVPSEGSSLMDFFTRSKFPLLKLEMPMVEFHYEELFRILRAAPSITHLHLFPLIDGEQLEDEALSIAPLLRELAQSSGPNVYEDTTTPLLPCLQSLEYGLYFNVAFPWSLVPGMFGSPSALSSPNRRPLKSLKVVNENGRPENIMELKAIPKDVLPKLIELRQSGVDITYIDGNRNDMDIFAMSMTFHDQEV